MDGPWNVIKDNYKGSFWNGGTIALNGNFSFFWNEIKQNIICSDIEETV